MGRYVILISERDGTWDRLPEAEQDSLVRRYLTWADDLKKRNRLRSGEPVVGGGTTLRMAGGRLVEAPYSETKDVLTGFFVVEAENLEEAAAIARTCPALSHGETVVVRPLGNAPKPDAGIRFLYLMCNDVAAMKKFYVDLLGMKSAGFMDSPQFAYFVVQSDGFQMMWFRAEKPLPVPQEFAGQPGWQGGSLEATSWGILIPEEDFPATVERLKSGGVRCFASAPQWLQDSYWGFPVLDPMGATVEVYTTPREKPKSTTWPGR